MAECNVCGLVDDHAVGCPEGKRPPPTMPERVLSDVPTTALARSPAEQRALLSRMTGDDPPNTCRFVCIMCGWDKTLEFDEDEMATLGGDVRTYTGPCAACSSMTLAPYDKLLGKDFKPIGDIARENQREAAGIAADVFLERAEQKLGTILTGGSIKGSPASAPAADGRPPGQRDDLPDDSEIDPTTLKPRQG